MSYASEVLADSPLVYLTLDDSASPLVDSSGNSHNATLTGGTLGQTSLLPSGGGTALKFATVSDFAQIAQASWMNTANFSVDCWIKMNTSASFHAIISRDTSNSGGLWTFYVKDGVLAIHTGSGTTHAGSTTLTNGTTYHVALTFNLDTASLYVNGVLDTAFPGLPNGGSNSSGTEGLDIGFSFAAAFGGKFFSLDGTMDELAFYGAGLSVARVAAHFAAGSAGAAKPASPVIATCAALLRAATR